MAAGPAREAQDMKIKIFECLLVIASPLIAAAAPVSSQYLFVWAMEAQHPQASTLDLMSDDLAAWRRTQGLGKDFLAVFDIRPGVSFGKLVAMLPVGDAVMAHHTNYAEPEDDVLYANDWIANRTYVFDLHSPRGAAPRAEIQQCRRLQPSTLLCTSFQWQYARNIPIFRRLQPRRGRIGGVRSGWSGSEERLGRRARISRYSPVQPGSH